MATGVQVWSGTPVTNATVDSNINFAEGMAPSQVNDSARSLMASVAKWRDDNTGVLVTSGTSGALTLATNQVESALTTGFTVTATLGTAMSGAATLAVDGLTATSIFTGLTTASLVSTGSFAANQICSFMFSTGVGPGNGWVVKAASAGSVAPLLTLVTSTSTVSFALVSTGTTSDVLFVSQGTTGTWLATANLLASDSAGASSIACKLWDGTTVISAGILRMNAVGTFASLSLTGAITNPAANIKVSVVPNGATSTIFNSTGFGPATYFPQGLLTAVRIA